MNKDHLAILRDEVARWNQWRQDNPTVTPDLRWFNLQGANLQMADLRGANLEPSKLWLSGPPDQDE